MLPVSKAAFMTARAMVSDTMRDPIEGKPALEGGHYMEKEFL